MLRAALAAVAAGALLAGGAARAGTPTPVLGLAVAPPYSHALVRLDPLTLKRVGKSFVLVGDYAAAWAFSPDRSRLALGSGGTTTPRVRLVDVARMRRLRDVRIAGTGAVQGLQWVGESQLVAVAAPCCNFGSTTVSAIDTTGGAPRSIDLDGSLQAVARAPGSLVLLLGPEQGVGPSRLAIVGPSLAPTFVPLDRIESGLDDRGDHAVSTSAVPGLAVDGAGAHAYVADATSIADVDLRSLSVSYHPLGRSVAAAVKIFAGGYWRTVTWLAPHALLVAGSDAHAYLDVRAQPQVDTVPAGVLLVDTAGWRTTALDVHGDAAYAAAGALVTAGAEWHSEAQKSVSHGVSIYARDGTLRAHLSTFYTGIQIVGRRAFVPTSRTGGYLVVDCATGRIVRKIAGRALPLVLLP